MDIIILGAPRTPHIEAMIKALKASNLEINISFASEGNDAKDSEILKVVDYFDIDASVLNHASDTWVLQKHRAADDCFRRQVPKSLADRNRIDPGWWNNIGKGKRRKW
ncbi:hypothetical protein NVP2275O_116 [Vibrio phage 2.275.O._10N.286.54.E11]|nr:hypothetical protein NVP2275O_116 [Vibrio phage 2.275.O._10N.286.54.E11]